VFCCFVTKVVIDLVKGIQSNDPGFFIGVDGGSEKQIQVIQNRESLWPFLVD